MTTNLAIDVGARLPIIDPIAVADVEAETFLISVSNSHALMWKSELWFGDCSPAEGYALSAIERAGESL